MDRRTAFLALLTAVPFNRAEIQKPGILTVPLDLWKTVRVTYDGREIEIPVKAIFEELAKP